MHEQFRVGLEKWLYPGDNNSISKVIDMAKKKKIKTEKLKWCPYFHYITIST